MRNTVLKLSFLFFCLSAAVLLYLAADGRRAVKIRNSLLATEMVADQWNWPPNQPPTWYRFDTTRAPDALTLSIGRANLLRHDSMAQALAIANHIVPSDKRGKGIKKSTLNTYQAIVATGTGYCADYTQVFGAIAQVTGLPVREWGMSFDGFGGDGHAFSEFFSHELQQWVFFDTFFSFYVVDSSTDRPLSVDQFFDRLGRGTFERNSKVVPIDDTAFVFGNQAKAVRYYSRGSAQRFLWMGSNTFEVESHPLVRLAATLGRSAEQFVAIALGIHPRIAIVRTKDNAAALDRLHFYRHLTVASLSVMLMSIFALVIAITVRILGRKRLIHNSLATE